MDVMSSLERRPSASPKAHGSSERLEPLARRRRHQCRRRFYSKGGAMANDLSDRLETIAKCIESLTVKATLRVAAQIAEAHEIFRYRRDEGGFAGWVERRLGYSRQTAYNLLHVHERFNGQE